MINSKTLLYMVSFPIQHCLKHSPNQSAIVGTLNTKTRSLKIQNI